VVTVSDRTAGGRREDRSGPPLVARLVEAGYAVDGPVVVPDGVEPVRQALEGAITDGYPMVVTNGGTGLAPRDCAREAARAVVPRELVGVAELRRREGARHTPLAALARGIVGVSDSSEAGRIGTLLVNLPGSPQAVEQSVAALLPLLP